MENSILIEKLVQLRKTNEFSQAFVANELGITIKNYMDIENGSKSCNSANLKCLSKLYEVSLESLVDDEIVIEYNLVEKTDTLKLDEITEKLDNKSITRKRRIVVIASSIILALLLLVSLLTREKELDLSLDPLNSITSSDTTVVVIDNGQTLQMSGLNDNSDSLIFNNIVKVKENNNYTIGLDKYGQLIYDNEALYQLSGIDKLNLVKDFELGSTHMLVLDDDDNLNCLGNNEYNQCDVFDWININKIYAKSNGSIGITNENTCFATGDIIDIDKLSDLNDIKDITFSDTILVYLNVNNKVIALNDYAKQFDLSNWNDIVDIQCGNDYIAGLTKDGQVKLAIDDYKTIDLVTKWTDIISISGSSDFLVAYDGNEVYGVGDNEYNQFKNYDIDEITPQLSRVNNIQIEFGYEFAKIEWDKVDNANYYSVQINVGTGYSTKVSNNSILVDVDKFSNGQEYFVKITSLSDSINFRNSEPIEQAFIYIKKSDPTPTPTISPTNEPIEIPSLITLETLTGKTKDNFEIYMNGLGVLRNNLIGVEDPEVDCQTDKAIVLTVDGVENNEEITLEELDKRVINYTYCKLPEPSPSPTPTSTPSQTPTPVPTSDNNDG